MNRTSIKKAFLAVTAPLAALVLMEGVLALGGWFEPVRLLVPVRHAGTTYFQSNPGYGSLLFPRKDLPMPSPIWVRKEKQPGVKRAVLIGESAAAGFPHPEFNLARMVEHTWRARYPDQPLEVVNLTMVGINSHILRLFAREAMQLDPDVLILYAGHNEVIGPYGPASVFGRHISSINLVRLNLWVRNLRLGRLVDALYRRATGRSHDQLPAWMGLEEFAEVPIRPDDPRLEVMAGHFRDNLHDLVDDAARNRVPVLVLTPAVNLTDWPPLGGEAPQLTDEEADAMVSSGGLDRLESAHQVYRLAERRSREGAWDRAWPLYRRALDLDLFRFRADSRIRNVVLSMAGRWSARQCAVVDVDGALHEGNPRFTSDRELFCEHVHLTFPGRMAVAALAVDGLAPLLGATSMGGEAVLSVSDMAKRTLFTPMDEYAIWQEVWRLLSLGVFSRQPGSEERSAFISATVRELRAQFQAVWNPSLLTEAYQQAQRMHPGDPMLDLIAGRLFMDMGAWNPARAALQRGLDRWPGYHSGWCDLAVVSMATMDLTAAEQALIMAERYSIDNPRIPALRGEWYARSGDLVQARRELEIAVSNRPHYQAMVNLANVYALQGMKPQAITLYSRCAEQNDADAMVLNNLAWLVAESTDSTPAERLIALKHAERAVFLRPDVPRYHASLALALAAAQRTNDAVAQARSAVQQMTQVGDHQGVAELVAALSLWDLALPSEE